MAGRIPVKFTFKPAAGMAIHSGGIKGAYLAIGFEANLFDDAATQFGIDAEGSLLCLLKVVGEGDDKLRGSRLCSVVDQDNITMELPENYPLASGTDYEITITTINNLT
jgi:hypothetical protein